MSKFIFIFLITFSTASAATYMRSVEISNFPDTQMVSGSVTVDNQPTNMTVDGSVAVSNFPSLYPVSGTFWQSTQPVSGPLTDVQLRATALPVSISNFPFSQLVSGTFWQAVQPVSGPLTDIQLRASVVGVSVSNFPVTQSVSGNIGITDNSRATYSVSASDLVPASLATDILTISGSSTKTIKIYQIGINGTATTAAIATCNFIKRSTSNTGGTSSSVIPAKHDSSDSSSTVSVLKYTANPSSLGASAGIIRSRRLNFQNASVPSEGFVIDFSTRNNKPIILRGTSEFLAINLNATSLSGAVISIWIEFTEE